MFGMFLKFELTCRKSRRPFFRTTTLPIESAPGRPFSRTLQGHEIDISVDTEMYSWFTCTGVWLFSYVQSIKKYVSISAMWCRSNSNFLVLCKVCAASGSTDPYRLPCRKNVSTWGKVEHWLRMLSMYFLGTPDASICNLMLSGNDLHCIMVSWTTALPARAS